MHKLLTKIEAEDMDRVRYVINCRLDSIFSDWAIIWWWIRPERTTIVFQGSSDVYSHAVFTKGHPLCHHTQYRRCPDSAISLLLTSLFFK